MTDLALVARCCHPVGIFLVISNQVENFSFSLINPKSFLLNDKFGVWLLVAVIQQGSF